MKKKITLKNVKGSYNYMPEEQKIRNYIKDTLRGVFEEYGYKPLETPILCYYDLLAGKYDESNDLLNEIYKLTDQGERKLGLRYDLTVPFAKCIAMTKDLRLPFKRYEIGEVFRDGPVKVGRDREFMQCDVDVVGLDGQLIEAELISLWLKGYSAMGIDVFVKYNSRNLMRGLITKIGITQDEEIDKVVTVIDKIDKLTKEELNSELRILGIEENKSLELLDWFNQDLEKLKNKFYEDSNDMLKKGFDELSELQSILEKIGLKEKTAFTPSLARGQEYYTGNVFEVYAKNGELTCSLGGGGRYDNMITDFIDDGNVYPAVGVSFGLSTIYEILRNRDDFKKSSLVDIYIIPLGEPVEALKLANSLRDYGFKIDIEMQNKKLKKSFEYADRENIPFVIVLGENEVKEKTFKVKNLETGTETVISMENLKEIKSIF